MLGKGPPGGAWHRMDPNLRTLSLSAWMSLPGFDFHAWERLNPATDDAEEAITEKVAAEAAPVQTEKSPLQRRNLSLRGAAGGGGAGGSGGKRKRAKEVETRALISRVARYYQDYVKKMQLEKFFWNDVTVTSVFPVRVHGNRAMKSARWMVVG